jgi:hypothetical protein
MKLRYLHASRDMTSPKPDQASLPAGLVPRLLTRD